MSTAATDEVTPVTARKMWRTLEPVHGMIYFTSEAADAYAAVGLDDIRAGYFASRAAPMGAVTAEVVIATFYNFNPALVRRVVPRCWTLASPERLVEARLAATDVALRRLLGEAVGRPEMTEGAALARRAATAPLMSPAGRPLYAGHTSLRWPDAPHLVLWHAISLLREYRGDGHIATMVADGLDGCEALVIHAATGEVSRQALQESRAWDDDDWAAAEARLRAKGWLDAEGDLTEDGKRRRTEAEDVTDSLALIPWQHLGAAACDRLRALVRPFSKAIVAAGTFGEQ